MKVLVLGGGGREHALVWKLRQSPSVTDLYCAPGNGGIASVAACVPLHLGDHAEVIAFARKERISLIVVGPDDALAAGIVDDCEAAGLRIFGPRKSAAKLEWSKVFAKEFMHRHGIPTAASAVFSLSADAQKYAQSAAKPLVLKADGLALGKGVIIARTGWEAALAIHQIMDEGRFGDAGKQLVIEEFLEGPECSVHAFVDGVSYLLMPAAQDHKRALDGDCGLNTGGMGTFSPTAAFDPVTERRVRSEVLDRFVAGLRADGIDFRGTLFPGIICTRDGPKVLEFNCRFGDPETQVLLPRLESDLLPILEATIDGRLAEVSPRWSASAAVCVVLASGGYPEKYETGKPISGLDSLGDDVLVFHAGVRRRDDALVTAGGRVLGVTALEPTLPQARRRAYEAAEKIHFERRHFRTDIAAREMTA